MSLLNDMQTLLRHAMWEDSCNKSPLETVDTGEDGIFVDMGTCNYPILTGDLSKRPFFWVSVTIKSQGKTYHWRSEPGGVGVEMSRHQQGEVWAEVVNLDNFIDTPQEISTEEVDLMLIAYPWVGRAAEILARAVLSPQFKRVRMQDI